MSVELQNRPFQERFQHLLTLISSERFLKRQGLGNEVPFFICPFKAEEAVEMGRMQKQLINRLDQNGVHILEINLYDTSIELLRRRGIWDQILQMESTTDKDEIKELLQGVLDPENHLIPEIAAMPDI